METPKCPVCGTNKYMTYCSDGNIYCYAEHRHRIQDRTAAEKLGKLDIEGSLYFSKEAQAALEGKETND